MGNGSGRSPFLGCPSFLDEGAVAVVKEIDGNQGECENREGGEEEKQAAAAGFGGGADGVGFRQFGGRAGCRWRDGRLGADGNGDDGGWGDGWGDVVFACDFAFEPGEMFADEVALTLKLGEPLRVHGGEPRGGGEIRKKKKRRGWAALEE